MGALWRFAALNLPATGPSLCALLTSRALPNMWCGATKMTEPRRRLLPRSAQTHARNKSTVRTRGQPAASSGRTKQKTSTNESTQLDGGSGLSREELRGCTARTTPSMDQRNRARKQQDIQRQACASAKQQDVFMVYKAAHVLLVVRALYKMRHMHERQEMLSWGFSTTFSPHSVHSSSTIRATTVTGPRGSRNTRHMRRAQRLARKGVVAATSREEKPRTSANVSPSAPGIGLCGNGQWLGRSGHRCSTV